MAVHPNSLLGILNRAPDVDPAAMREELHAAAVAAGTGDAFVWDWDEREWGEATAKVDLGTDLAIYVLCRAELPRVGASWWIYARGFADEADVRRTVAAWWAVLRVHRGEWTSGERDRFLALLARWPDWRGDLEGLFALAALRRVSLSVCQDDGAVFAVARSGGAVVFAQTPDAAAFHRWPWDAAGDVLVRVEEETGERGPPP